jgi:hypothetical protein
MDDSLDDVPHRPSAFKRCVRVALAGVIFGVPLGCATPSSPLFRLLVSKDSIVTLAPKVSMQFTGLSASVVAVTYWLTVERRQENRVALEGLLPYVGPPRGALLTLSALTACHLWFPGSAAFVHEVPGKQLSQYVRMTAKCFVAFLPVHGVYALSVGLGCGFCLWPFMIAKDAKEALRRKALLPPVVNLGSVTAAEP